MQEISTTEELDEILGSERAVVIDFWGQTCGPCLAMAPYYEALAEHFAEDEIAFYKCNTAMSPGVAAAFNVRALPTFIFVLDGDVVDHNVGACDPQRLKKKADRLLSKARGETFLGRLFGGKKS